MTEPSSPTHWHHHRAFGLNLRSRLPLPELLPGGLQDPIDVEIDEGSVPAELPAATRRSSRYQAAPGQLLIKVDAVARVLITEGRSIVIEREADADDDDIRIFLLGWGISALLLQRHDLVLHGSAINWNGSAVAFIGASGVGKSTLAAAFRRRGHTVLTDDLAVVRAPTQGFLTLQPGIPHNKLWMDSLQQLGISPEGLRRIRRKIEKRVVPLAQAFAPTALPVGKLYLLCAHTRPDIRIQSVQGPQKAMILRDHTCGFGFLVDTTEQADHFRMALQLAQQSPLAIIQRPANAFLLEELVDHIATDLGTNNV